MRRKNGWRWLLVSIVFLLAGCRGPQLNQDYLMENDWQIDLSDYDLPLVYDLTFQDNFVELTVQPDSVVAYYQEDTGQEAGEDAQYLLKGLSSQFDFKLGYRLTEDHLLHLNFLEHPEAPFSVQLELEDTGDLQMQIVDLENFQIPEASKQKLSDPVLTLHKIEKESDN